MRVLPGRRERTRPGDRAPADQEIFGSPATKRTYDYVKADSAERDENHDWQAFSHP